MKKTKETRHIVDILFVIGLFCAFALSAIFIISIGARIYSKTMITMNDNFSSRTASAYIIEKIRQSDEAGSVSVGNFDNIPAIEIISIHNDKKYITYIYEYKHQLKELTVRENISLSPEAGQDIISVQRFEPRQTSPELIQCSLLMNNNENYDFFVALHSGGDY